MSRTTFVADRYLGAAPPHGHARCPFIVADDHSYGGDHALKADLMGARLEAEINQTQATSQSPTFFDMSGFFVASGFFLQGLAQPALLNSTGVNGYRIYGLFQASGTIALEGSGAVAEFQTGGVALYVTLDDGDSLSGARNDVLLCRSGLLLTGSQARFSKGGAPAGGGGSLDLYYGAVELSYDGSLFFTDPSPFYPAVRLSSEDARLEPTLTSGNYSGTVVGSSWLAFCFGTGSACHPTRSDLEAAAGQVGAAAGTAAQAGALHRR